VQPNASSVPCVLELHRDNQMFYNVALKSIMAYITQMQPDFQRHANDVKELRIETEPKDQRKLYTGCAVRLLPEYRELPPTTVEGKHATLYDELASRFEVSPS
jgi:hypothetical protein